jgi:hypothetical protein
MNDICLDCQRRKRIQGRGLCETCYGRNYRAGTIDRYPRRACINAGPSVVDGLSYRRLDMWTSRGLLEADVRNPGSGQRRTWSESELVVAAMMARLTDAGLTIEAAHRVARAGGETELAPGIRVAMLCEVSS